MNRQEIMRTLDFGTHQQKIDYLNDLDMIFDSYNRNIANADEVVQTLLEYAITPQDDDILDQMLEAICAAQISQELLHVDYSVLAKHMNRIPEKFLPRAIDILSYSHNKKWVPTIISFENSADNNIKNAVKDALIEIGFHKQ